MNIPILFEDSHMIAILKPAGMVVNRARTVEGETVQDWVEKRAKSKEKREKSEVNPRREGFVGQGSGMLEVGAEKLNVGSGKFEVGKTDEGDETLDYTDINRITDEFVARSGIVHRIDKETSGVLLIAKDPQSFLFLKTQFMNRTVKKTYVCLTHGQMPSKEGNIAVPVGRLPWNRQRFGVVSEGKEAVTQYEVAKEFKKESGKNREIISLVYCYPKTGRTHQIRVHMKYIGHPIVGDYLYAGRKTAREDRRWVCRVMLHAGKIAFDHPATHKPTTIEAPMPEDMKEVIGSLEV